MSSVFAAPAQVPANKLYVNIVATPSSITDTNGNLVPWLSAPAAAGIKTAGGAILRDLGRNVYGPNPNVPSAIGSQSTIYRKVQLVTTGAGGYYGTGGDASYFTGYISLGAQTYGGGNGQAIGNTVVGTPVGLPAPWVRLN
jgi:hypothetical protein